MSTLGRIVGWVCTVVGALVAVPLLLLAWIPSTQYLHTWLVGLATFVPFAWAPTLLLLLGLGLVLGRYWRILPIALATVLVAAWGYPLLGTTDADPPAAGDLQYVSVNASYGTADVGQLLAETPASTDLLVIQEFTPPMQARLEAAGIAKRFPHRAGEARVGAGGTVVYAARPVREVDRHDDVFLNLLVEVTDEQGRTHHVAAIHAAPPTMGADVWRDDARAIAAMLAPHAGGDCTAVGDFNAIDAHATMRELEALGMTDPMDGTSPRDGRSALTRWQPTWPVGTRLPTFARIDHVLVGRGMTASEPQHVTIPGTDHKALRGGVWTTRR
ncbi:endonuclease/exonuclease/phosphatase family protein [uncultured Tessaracoccus sp.]|uniref:endonuclease/exonuclease/phosphatase family protein n=1 Tax=uncultured Tessaracoccus sp. TaxID=905023 RepID=UPI0025F3E127|nr:endonuclease/exonuclease/phosphatase family protein [uncultured Tessaracoccus sp.]